MQRYAYVCIYKIYCVEWLEPSCLGAVLLRLSDGNRDQVFHAEASRLVKAFPCPLEAFPLVLPNKPSHAYYDERFTRDNHVKAYEQRKTVRDKPNPPPGEWSASNGRYDTGYADYQPGYIYISADCLQVKGVSKRPLRPRPTASILKAKAKVKAKPQQPSNPTKVQKVTVMRLTASKRDIMRRKWAVEMPKASKFSSKEWKTGSKRQARSLWPKPSPKCIQSAPRAAKRKPQGFWVWIEE